MTTDSEPWSVPADVVAALAKAHAAFPFPELENLPPVLKMHQAVAASGFSYSTIRRRISDGTLLAFRAGPREIRVDRDSLIKLVRSTVVGA